jgi:hypothetical protein
METNADAALERVTTDAKKNEEDVEDVRIESAAYS